MKKGGWDCDKFMKHIHVNICNPKLDCSETVFILQVLFECGRSWIL